MGNKMSSSDGVALFLTRYHQLKEWSDNDPAALDRDMRTDESLRRLCADVWFAAFPLAQAERTRWRSFAAPVDPAFISEWRDYMDRYESIVAGAQLFDMGVDIGETAKAAADRFDQRWHYARDEALDNARAIETALEHARIDVSNFSRDYAEGYAEEIERGLDQWARLKKVTGFNLADIFRRRELIPFTLIPRHVSAKHGEGESMSLYSHLQEAHEAFVFGVPFAALAMMRSILELVLREHYGSTGDNLEELINNARSLPKSAGWKELHKLRKLANSVLHFGTAPIPAPSELERRLVGHLLCLRDLIEAAPVTR